MIEMNHDHYYDRQTELKQLSYINASEDYQVDKHGIYLDEKNNRFVYLWASGCSCWSGECNEFIFDSWKELKEFFTGDTVHYLPSLNTSISMLDEAEATLVTLLEPKQFLC